MLDKSKLGTPITVFSPNGAKDEYYWVNNRPYEIDYFAGGGIAIANFFNVPLTSFD